MAQPADRRVGRLVVDLGPARALERILAREPGLRARADSLWGSGPPLDALGARGVRLVVPGDREWPTQLADLGEAMPYALWVVGEADLRLVALRSVAIVGARAATAYGERVAREWAAHLAERNWNVVSGGAFGVDAAAHRGALNANGVSICVLACGADVAYPTAHAELLARIADQGILVSEAPPGTPVRRHRFLSRNRVIATLTRCTVVVEAAARSGTTATANAAYLANRPVVAVPGPIGSLMSAGCHRLIRDGTAVLGTQIDDVLELLTPSNAQVGSDALVDEPSARRSERASVDGLSLDVLRVLDALRPRHPTAVDEILLETGLAPRVVAAALGELTMRGLIASSATGWTVLTVRGAARSSAHGRA